MMETLSEHLQLHRTDLIARVDARMPWPALESQLRQEGFTLGWGPVPGPECTLGALLSQRVRGLRSAQLGEVTRSCIALEGTLPGGQAVQSRCVPRSAAGPDFKHLLLGGHGRTGKISAATLRIYPIPALRLPLVLCFQSPLSALQLLQELQHRGAMPAIAWLQLPASARGLETPAGSLPALETLLLLTFEGDVALTQARHQIALRLARALQPSPQELPLPQAANLLNQLEYLAEHPELLTQSTPSHAGPVATPAPAGATDAGGLLDAAQVLKLLHQPLLAEPFSYAALSHLLHQDTTQGSSSAELVAAIAFPAHEDAYLLLAPAQEAAAAPSPEALRSSLHAALAGKARRPALAPALSVHASDVDDIAVAQRTRALLTHLELPGSAGQSGGSHA